jgi:ATP-binding cassette subfamily C exporter for protease/lipase
LKPAIPNKPISELRQAIEDQRPQIMRSFVYSLIAGILVLAPTFYMFEVYGRVLDSRSEKTLLVLTLLVVWVYVVMEVLEWARLEIMRRSGNSFDQALRKRVFNAILQINRIRGQSSGVQPLTDLKTLREFFHSPALMAAFESPTSLVFLVILFVLSPLLGYVSLGLAIIQVVLGYLNDRRTQPLLLEANKSAIQAQTYADASLRNAQVIEAMGMLRSIHRRWFDKQRSFLKQQAIASERAGGFQAATKFLQLFMSSGLLGLGAWLVLHDGLLGGPGMMIVASVLGGRVVQPMAQLVTNWKQVVNARDAYTRLDQMLNAVPPRDPSMPLPAPVGKLLVESLVAGAPGTQAPIIRGVQFGLSPGEVLAVIGPSASGKTTLARLLVGLWPAMSGKVRLDGSDVYLWNKEELGPHMGYLPQSVELFEGTIAENIARFYEPDPVLVEKAARDMGLHEFILSLPQGYNTQIGPEGHNFSGGQRQRIAAARAIYGNPALVVLDEPNSSLDEAGDQSLANMINARKAIGTTFVVITHRTSLLGVSDKILLMRDGAQQAFGPRDEVLKALAQAQQKAAQPLPPAAAGVAT